MHAAAATPATLVNGMRPTWLHTGDDCEWVSTFPFPSSQFSFLPIPISSNATVDKHRVTISRVATHTNTAAVAGDSNAQRMCERPLKLYNVLSVDIKSASNDKSGLTETNPVQLLQLCFCMAVGQFCIATCFSKIAHLPLLNTSVHFARKETRSAVDSAWFKLENRLMLNRLGSPIK